MFRPFTFSRVETIMFLILLVFHAVWETIVTLPTPIESPYHHLLDGNPIEKIISSEVAIQNAKRISGLLLNTTKDSSSFHEECRITSSVQVRATSPFWTIKTFDDKGQEKSVGGDEFYVTYIDDSKLQNNQTKPKSKYTAVAHIRDMQNGMYELDFVTPPMEPNLSIQAGKGMLSVELLYSCGIGAMFPPKKEKWEDGGAIRERIKMAVTAPPIRAFQPPRGVDLAVFKKIVALGDSLICQLITNASPCKEWVVRNSTFFLPDRSIYKENANSRMTSSSFMAKLEKWHDTAMREPGVALLTGSSVWDIVFGSGEGDFDYHFAECRKYIMAVREKYPNVTIVWKSPSALHIQNLPTICTGQCSKSTKYLSNSKMKVLYEGQKRLMEELQVPFMDVHEAYFLSDDQMRKYDGRHFTDAFNAKVLSYFLVNDPIAMQRLLLFQ